MLRQDFVSDLDSALNGWNDYLDEKHKLSQAVQHAQSNYRNGPKNITNEAKARIDALDRIERQLRILTSESFRRMFEFRRKDLFKRHNNLLAIAPSETPDLWSQEWNPATFPRIDGSTSTQPLAMLIACRAMHSLVMQGEAMSPTVSDRFVEQLMSDVFLTVSQEKNAIAYSIWYYEKFMTVSSGTKVLKINGFEPTWVPCRPNKSQHVEVTVQHTKI